MMPGKKSLETIGPETISANSFKERGSYMPGNLFSNLMDKGPPREFGGEGSKF